ncbi:MAG: methyl-accepting chemotaxis protein [Actinomycetaceae bacterium]|nr:methyl-accepting chemotaxis protein [Actinomycetaceae bacterium]
MSGTEKVVLPDATPVKNKRQGRINTKIIVVGLTGIVVSIVVAITGVLGLLSYQAGFERNSVFNQALLNIEKMRYDAMDADGWVEGLMRRARNGDPVKAAAKDGEVYPGLSASKENSYLHLEAIPLNVLTPEQAEVIPDLKQSWDAYWKNVDQVFELLNARKMDAAEELVRGPISDTLWPLVDKADELTKSVEGNANAENAKVTAIFWKTVPIMILTMLAGVVITIFATTVISRGIRKGITAMLNSVMALSNGDLTSEINVKSNDEIGQMAVSLKSAQDTLSGIIGSAAKASQQVESVSTELAGTSHTVSDAAKGVSSRSHTVADVATQVSANVQTLATGLEEMGASIREISSNAQTAASVASTATEVADRTTKTVARLGESSQQIGDVIKSITSIAEQTNLLALNATIEAARAGEAGKGFAVVAGEVKELAGETGSATETISAQITEIQEETQRAVHAIEEITSIINEIASISTTIAAAVEEQTATTNEMSRSVHDAAAGTSEIAENVVEVARESEQTSEIITDLGESIGTLRTLATNLNTELSSFKYQ